MTLPSPGQLVADQGMMIAQSSEVVTGQPPFLAPGVIGYMGNDGHEDETDYRDIVRTLATSRHSVLRHTPYDTNRMSDGD